jgi:NTE family protein
MYGAYQAGAWRALADVFHPDLVVGVSIGAVNGWAIAGGCDPDELVHQWLHLDAAARYRWKFPRSPRHGLFDTRALRHVLRHVYDSYRPRTEFALVATDVMRMKPRVFRGPEISWQHLAASAALPVLFDQVRVEGRTYTDGGLLAAVPEWVAAEMGATKALVINVLPSLPAHFARPFVDTMRRLFRFRIPVPNGLHTIHLGPSTLLGSPLESIYWTRANAEAWIRAGEEQASAMKHSIANCFERE